MLAGIEVHQIRFDVFSIAIEGRTLPNMSLIISYRRNEGTPDRSLKARPQDHVLVREDTK